MNKPAEYGSGMFSDKKRSTNNGKFWRWLLAGTLLNLCVTSVVVGLTVFYVHKELLSFQHQMALYEERLVFLEKATLQQGGHDRTWRSPYSRQRRDGDTSLPTGYSADQNSSSLSRQFTGNSIANSDGRDGRDGRDGMQGSPGVAGPPGAKGDQGDAGVPGAEGLPGLTGPRGPKGDPGEISEPADDHVNGPSGGDTYVRWGRTTCPSSPGTELVYSGYAAGAHHSHKGGSVDFFCLPTDPDWPTSFNDDLDSKSYLYGVEYQLDYFNPFSHDNARTIYQHNAPCAVCRLVDRGTQMLFPAKLGCPENWTEEYRGFLMSGKYDHEQRSRAVCVDQAPEVIPGTGANQNEAMFFILEARCGSLPCLPYVNGREIACTACSI